MGRHTPPLICFTPRRIATRMQISENRKTQPARTESARTRNDTRRAIQPARLRPAHAPALDAARVRRFVDRARKLAPAPGLPARARRRQQHYVVGVTGRRRAGDRAWAGAARPNLAAGGRRRRRSGMAWTSRYRADHRWRDRLSALPCRARHRALDRDRKSTRLNSSHVRISYAVFCLKKKTDNLSIF